MQRRENACDGPETAEKGETHEELFEDSDNQFGRRRHRSGADAERQCGMRAKPVPPANSPDRVQTSFIHVAYRPALFRLVDNDSDGPAVVGMWSVLFTSTDGKTVVDLATNNGIAMARS